MVIKVACLETITPVPAQTGKYKNAWILLPDLTEAQLRQQGGFGKAIGGVSKNICAVGAQVARVAEDREYLLLYIQGKNVFTFHGLRNALTGLRVGEYIIGALDIKVNPADMRHLYGTVERRVQGGVRLQEDESTLLSLEPTALTLTQARQLVVILKEREQQNELAESWINRPRPTLIADSPEVAEYFYNLIKKRDDKFDLIYAERLGELQTGKFNDTLAFTRQELFRKSVQADANHWLKDYVETHTQGALKDMFFQAWGISSSDPYTSYGQRLMVDDTQVVRRFWESRQGWEYPPEVEIGGYDLEDNEVGKLDYLQPFEEQVKAVTNNVVRQCMSDMLNKIEKSF